MKVLTTGVLLLALSLSAPIHADKSDSPARSFVEAGVTAYIKGGAKEAIKFWLKGSALEGNPQSLTQANNLTQIEDFYGKPIGFDLVKEYASSPKSRILYFTVNYEKGVAFGVFQLYQTATGQWISTQFSFNTDALKVFPSCLFSQ